MSDNHEFRELSLNDVLINPDNSRFINTDNLTNEVDSINQLIEIQNEKLIYLAKDIVAKGLNPHEIPIAYYDESSNKYIVADGNRRITAIKLLTIYSTKLDLFKMTSGFKNSLVSIIKNNKGRMVRSNMTIPFVVYDSEESVRDLLEKTHTDISGVSRDNWDAISKDRHKARNGYFTERYSVVDFVNNSKFTSEEVRHLLSKPRWLSKFERLIKVSEMSRFFGLEMRKLKIHDSTPHYMVYFIEEAEIIKGLEKAIKDLAGSINEDGTENDAVTANDSVGTLEQRKKYIRTFDYKYVPDIKKRLPTPLIYDPIKKESIPSDGYKIPTFRPTTRFDYDAFYSSFESPPISDPVPEPKMEPETQPKPEPTMPSDQEPVTTPDPKPEYPGIGQEPTPSQDNTDTNNGTTNRNTVIPEDEILIINNIRIKDIFEELKKLPCNRYPNASAILLRSFMEFSLNEMIDKYQSSFAKYKGTLGRKAPSLHDKIKFCVIQLESIHSKNVLEKKIQPVYMSINSAESRTQDLLSFFNFNSYTHNKDSHPIANDLKIIYNNYRIFIKLVYDVVNS